ncbi:hypothetical protein D9Q98_000330 [Chlorella vulgaris]|uniref:LysM domain-containing protein n=1 Tax=Chlorella vulgaris TaxID=3077 RepID=A0A9D4TXX6_CHLVU|nr:hypothetical protein D9Q98_000330 [Chlorella vulgaris]
MAREEQPSGQLEPCSAASSSGEESTSTADPLADYFIRHKLTKLDTLAGLAVRYNVTVSDIKRANGLLADSAMFGKDTLLIPTRPLPVGPEYSTWAGMIVTHYGRLGPSDDAEGSPYAHFSRNQAMQQMRGYYSTGPSRSHSPQYGSGADEGDRHHLFAFSGARSSSGARNGSWGAAAGQAQVVELMERHSVSASAHYIEERLRRRGRTDSQEDQPSSSSNGDPGTGGSSSSSFVGFDRQPLFAGAGASAAQAQALAKEGGRHLRHWKESLLQKLKRVASQPALAVPSSAVSSMQQLGQTAVATAPLLGSAVDARSDRSTTARQRPSSASQKADKAS